MTFAGTQANMPQAWHTDVMAITCPFWYAEDHVCAGCGWHTPMAIGTTDAMQAWQNGR